MMEHRWFLKWVNIFHRLDIILNQGLAAPTPFSVSMATPILGSQQGNNSKRENDFRNILAPPPTPRSALKWLCAPTAIELRVCSTYFQLWTKCRDWSQSIPAENAAGVKNKDITFISLCSSGICQMYTVPPLKSA